MIFWKPQQLQQEKKKKVDVIPKQDNCHLSKSDFLFLPTNTRAGFGQSWRQKSQMDWQNFLCLNVSAE